MYTKILNHTEDDLAAKECHWSPRNGNKTYVRWQDAVVRKWFGLSPELMQEWASAGDISLRVLL